MALADWSTEQLDEAVASHDTVLVDLRAPWCAQCGPQEQVIERLAPELAGRVVVGSVDVGEHVEVADRYGIQTLPALLVFRRGSLAGTLVGFKRAPLVRRALAEAMSSRQ